MLDIIMNYLQQSTCLKRAKTYRGKSLREFGAIKADCWRFDAVVIYADNESTTAFTKASLASERLDEIDLSTAVGSQAVTNKLGRESIKK